MQKIIIDYADNPNLKAALEMKEPGEDCEITLKLSTIEAGSETFEASVEEIIYDFEGEEMTVEPTTEEPVNLTMFSEIEDEELEDEVESEFGIGLDIPDIEGEAGEVEEMD